MKASELISKLHSMVIENGDRDVLFAPAEGGGLDRASEVRAETLPAYETMDTYTGELFSHPAESVYVIA